jgi:AcrR family transcriptional regulator
MAPLGRPRNPELDGAAMSAAIELLVEGGYPSLTMDHIAGRASVSKAALYRRWPNKLELVVEAIEVFAHNQVPLPDTGRAHDDIVEFLHTLVRSRRDDTEAHEALSAAIAADHELATRCRDTMLARFSASFRTIVTRAIARGELPPATDIELFADIAPDLLRYRRQTTGHQLDEAFIDRLADQFFCPIESTLPAQSGAGPI